MDADALYQVKKLIFFLPVLIAVAVAWRCFRRGVSFSYRLVYVLPLLLPTIFYFIQIRMGIDLMSPIVGENGELWFIAPYGCAAMTSGALTLLKSRSAFVRAGIGELSLPRLFFLHAGVFSLGLYLGIFIALQLAIEFGYTKI